MLSRMKLSMAGENGEMHVVVDGVSASLVVVTFVAQNYPEFHRTAAGIERPVLMTSRASSRPGILEGPCQRDRS